MWSLITTFHPPVPPQPQVPPELNIPRGLNPEELEERLRQELRAAKKDIPISYCSLLLDPTDKYEWVDKDLRKRIYECMYHRPQDRPKLPTLLEEALRKSIPDPLIEEESDESIRRWVNKWLVS